MNSTAFAGVRYVGWSRPNQRGSMPETPIA